MSDIAIVYMVAGMSSRFGGKIKQFSRVGPSNETLIEYSINQAISAGFNKIIFIVGKLTEQPFKEMFGDSYKGIPIHYVVQNFNTEQRDKPWGTTEALVSAKSIINCPFVICNGDDIYGTNTFKVLFDHLKDNTQTAAVGYKLSEVLPKEGRTNRGIFDVDEKNNVKKVVETFNIELSSLKEMDLTEDKLCSMNLFALNPHVVVILSEILEKFKWENKGDRKIECLLPVELSNLIEQNKISMKIYPAVDKWYGVTNPDDEEKVRNELLKL